MSQYDETYAEQPTQYPVESGEEQTAPYGAPPEQAPVPAAAPHTTTNDDAAEEETSESDRAPSALDEPLRIPPDAGY